MEEKHTTRKKMRSGSGSIHEKISDYQENFLITFDEIDHNSMQYVVDLGTILL